jgi:hypothetical protein
MTNEEKAKFLADQCKPCNDDFYSGFFQGVLVALNSEHQTAKSQKKTFTVPLEKLDKKQAEKTIYKLINEYKKETVLTEEGEVYFPISNNVKFTENDIKDKERLENMIAKEATQIFDNPQNRYGRDYDTIKYCVRQGKVAELYLIENFGYQESEIKYHDVVKNGEHSEVKAYNITSSTAPCVEKDLRRYRNAAWSKAKWYIIFKCVDGVYELLDIIKIK